jgi:hypothetical protein
MAQLVWDQVGERIYETGIDHGVLYLPNPQGAYVNGVAWNGLTSVSEAPSGAEANAQYADNIKYLNLISAEEFGATLEAFTYPDEFAEFDGLGVPVAGVTIGQQARRPFGLSYRTKVGNDTLGDDFGYKIHLIYGCQAAPSEKAYNTINDSPEAITFSWTITTSPVPVPNFRPTAQLVIDSTKVLPATLADLEQILYGDTGVDPALPLPGTIISMFADGVTMVTPNVPAFDSPTETITIPSQVGVEYFINGIEVPAGPVVITEDTIVTAAPAVGYVFTQGVDNDWFYDFTP